MSCQYLVVDHAMEYFYYQWNCGAQPCLTLKTLSDGTFEVSTTVSSSITAENMFLRKRKLEDTPRNCSKSGQSSRARRRAARHPAAKVELLQPVSNNNNVDEILSNSLEDRPVQIQLENHEPEVSKTDCEVMDTKVDVIEAELEICRNQNSVLTCRIEALNREIEKKERQIKKLELEVSTLKFKSFKPPRKLSFANVQFTDIPPSCPAK